MILLLVALAMTAGSPDTLTGLGAVPKESVRVLLVRHGQAYSNLDPKPKLPPEELDRLTALGQAQAKAAAEALRDRGIAFVATSPAGRANETADILRTLLGVPKASVDPRVRPFELGRSSRGQPLSWDDREAEWNAGRDPAPEGGESLRQLADRVIDLLAAMARTRPGQTIVIVTHGEVIAAVVGSIKGQPTREWEELNLENASATVVEAAAGKPPKLVRVNVSLGGAKP